MSILNGDFLMKPLFLVDNDGMLSVNVHNRFKIIICIIELNYHYTNHYFIMNIVNNMINMIYLCIVSQ